MLNVKELPEHQLHVFQQLRHWSTKVSCTHLMLSWFVICTFISYGWSPCTRAQSNRHAPDSCSCFCDAYQGYTGSSTQETFCVSFYKSVPSEDLLATALSIKNSVNLNATDFAQVAGRVLPPTYLVKVQGSLDVRAAGYYKFCVTASQPATVSFV
jgi:hypothetical protein